MHDKIVQKSKKNGEIGCITNILKSLMLAYLVTGVCLLILAVALYKLHLSESVIGIGIIVVYALASLIAGFFAGKCFGNHKFLWGLGSAAGYFLILLVVSYALREDPKEIVSNIYTTLAICAGSGMLGGMLA